SMPVRGWQICQRGEVDFPKPGSVLLRPSVVNYSYFSRTTRPPASWSGPPMFSRSPRAMWFSLALLAALHGISAANTPAQLTPAQTEEARLWVRQLSEKSFRTRELAARKLEDLGRSGIKV